MKDAFDELVGAMAFCFFSRHDHGMVARNGVHRRERQRRQRNATNVVESDGSLRGVTIKNQWNCQYATMSLPPSICRSVRTFEELKLHIDKTLKVCTSDGPSVGRSFGRL